jgi:hypothetical protein
MISKPRKGPVLAGFLAVKGPISAFRRAGELHGAAFPLPHRGAPEPGRAEAAPVSGAFLSRSCVGQSGGLSAPSMTSAHVPVRRRALVCLGFTVGWPASSRKCFARKLRIRSRLYAARVKPSITVILLMPMTRMNPRPRSVNAPFNAALTDSTTCRRC